jgi:acyl-CoA thioester hydrolase
MSAPDSRVSEGVKTGVDVRYSETDQQGVVYHAHYLVWMEIGRTDYLRAVHFPYHRLEADGVFFAVLEARCRYLGATRYGDRVEVVTRVRNVRSRTAVFDYTMSVDGRTIATGETTLIALDPDRRPRTIPEAIVRALREGTPAVTRR